MIHGPWIVDAISTYLTGKTVKALAVTSAHVPDADTVYRSSITGEITGTGYTPGGVVVSNVTVSWDATTDSVKLTCTLIDFGAVTASDVGGVVFYIDTGNPATDRVLATDVFAPVAADGTLTYEPSASGIMTVAVA